jgi:transposase InsO family protein
MVDYIDQHRDVFGVEPICRVLTEHGCTIAPSTYYAAKVRPPSSRAERHATLMPILLTLWVANYRVYGARKLWKAARRAGHAVGRDQVARLMAELGIGGVRRGRRVFTTRADPAAARPADLVQRRFAADRPNQLWVSDLTYVATWSGVAYVCFIVDAFSRMIVGWQVAPQDSRLEDPGRGLRRSPTLPPTGRCCDDQLSPVKSPRCATANGSPSSVPSPRSAQSATASTTRWPNRRSGFTRPS